jgi:hypothetical protein
VSAADRATVDHALIGAWRLRDWVALDDDGTTTPSMGDAPNGLVVYSADGTMVTVIGRADRPRFASDDVTGGTDEERAGAFRTFIAYGGRFTIHGDVVTHHVETSLFPNWIGTEQRRQWVLDDEAGVLTLTSPPLAVGGVTRVQRLTWVRQRD